MSEQTPDQQEASRQVIIEDLERARGRPVTPIHLLFECATGYALFLAKDITQVDLVKFEAAEEYINRSPQPFELIAYQPFSSTQDALIQIDAVSKSLVTDELLKFISDHSPAPTNGHSIGMIDSYMSQRIVKETKITCRANRLFNNVTRGLREKIDQFIPLKPGELERAQINLSRLHINRTRMEIDSPVLLSSSSSSTQEQVGVVPHRFKGFFNVKGEDILCTRNLVPGEALYGEKLVHAQNEDKIKVEYRVCDPLRSKLGAAIHQGLTNIWITPGSRVLYMGNVCGLTVADLSDLVGLDGLVYVVGLSDSVADMVGKRPNIVIIKGKPIKHYPYRMLIGMVDVVFAEIDHLPEQQGIFVVNNARHYLRTAGHYMISRQVKLTCNPIAAHDYDKEFKPVQTITVDVMEGAFVLDVGGFRMPRV